MAVYSQRTRTITYTEWTLPRDSAIGEFSKAWNVAWNQYLDERGLPRDSRMSDDWARVDADDDHIIIRITNEQVTPA